MRELARPLCAFVALAMLVTSLHAEIVTARTEQQVIQEELTVEASIARLKNEGLTAPKARAIAEHMTAEDHAYFQADSRRVQPGAQYWAVTAIVAGVRAFVLAR